MADIILNIDDETAEELLIKELKRLSREQGLGLSDAALHDIAQMCCEPGRQGMPPEVAIEIWMTSREGDE